MRPIVVGLDGGMVNVDHSVTTAAAVAGSSGSAGAAADIVDVVIDTVDGNEVDRLAGVDHGEIGQPSGCGGAWGRSEPLHGSGHDDGREGNDDHEAEREESPGGVVAAEHGSSTLRPPVVDRLRILCQIRGGPRVRRQPLMQDVGSWGVLRRIGGAAPHERGASLARPTRGRTSGPVRKCCHIAAYRTTKSSTGWQVFCRPGDKSASAESRCSRRGSAGRDCW